MIVGECRIEGNVIFFDALRGISGIGGVGFGCSFLKRWLGIVMLVIIDGMIDWGSGSFGCCLNSFTIRRMACCRYCEHLFFHSGAYKH